MKSRSAFEKTVLNIVSRSALRPAVPPLPAPPAPRKRPACLVKGIRANTIATRPPPEAVYPASIPALITTVNATLKKSADVNVQIKEILQGVRHHITVVFDKTAEEEESRAALSEVLKGFKTTNDASHVLERETYSI